MSRNGYRTARDRHRPNQVLGLLAECLIRTNSSSASVGGNATAPWPAPAAISCSA
jgi:hypothetical protein